MNMRTLIAQVPWWGKIAAKVVFSRLPNEYWAGRRRGPFLQGAMENPGYAYSVFKKHFDGVQLCQPRDGFVGLELGPGDSLFSAMVAYGFGASGFYLIDAGAKAQTDLKYYQGMAKFLREAGVKTPDLSNANNLEAVLMACGATYGTSGLRSLRTVPDRSVDFIFSHTVLQHLRRDEFAETLFHLRRILRPGGVSSHVVDLKDMLCESLNNLRFSDGIWESDFMRNSGFYTNRIRYCEMLSHFAEAGFTAEVLTTQRWKSIPIPRSKMAAPFRNLPAEDLCVSGFWVRLRVN